MLKFTPSQSEKKIKMENDTLRNIFQPTWFRMAYLSKRHATYECCHVAQNYTFNEQCLQFEFLWEILTFYDSHDSVKARRQIIFFFRRDLLPAINVHVGLMHFLHWCLILLEIFYDIFLKIHSTLWLLRLAHHLLAKVYALCDIYESISHRLYWTNFALSQQKSA